MPLVLVTSRKDFRSDELADRFSSAPGGPITERVKFIEAEEELAFVVLDWWHGEPYVVLYELWVETSKRGRGVGAVVLSAVEALARERGRSRVYLLPRPIDSTRTEADLQAWYSARGYSKIPTDRNDMFGKQLGERRHHE